MLGHYLNSSTIFGYWPLQSNANDLSGNGYNLGSGSGSPTYAISNGRFGSGMNIPGGYAYGLAVGVSLTVTQNKTISCWIYPTGFTYTGGQSNCWIFGENISASESDCIGLALHNGYPYYMVYNGTNYATTSTYLCTVNTWINLIVTVNGTSHKYYINGVLHDTQTAGGSISNFTATQINVTSIDGNYANGNYDDPFIGNICEVIVDNSVWSAIQIQKYYTFCKGRFVV